jgi:hypothetical protein
MRYLLSICLLFTVDNLYGQRKYDFDKPYRAQSNEGVYDWYIEQLDDTCDSLVNELFSSIGVHRDSIQWMYPTDLTEVLYEKGMDYYSRRVYFVNDRDKKIECVQKNVSDNKLPHSQFKLSYYFKNGITTLVLFEYY